MSRYHAGITQTRCMEHPQAAEINLTMRAVLAAMGWWASDGATDPQCRASSASIAKRAGARDRSTVIRAQERLSALGLIEHLPTEPGKPARWRLLILAPDAAPEGVAQSYRSGPGNVWPTATPPVAQNHTTCGPEPHNPSVVRPTPREVRTEEDRESADAAPSALEGSGPAAAPSTDEPGGIVREVMDALGCTQALAEDRIRRMVDGASGPVRNLPAFVRACLAREAASKTARKAPSAAEGRRSASAAKEATPRAGRKPKRRAPSNPRRSSVPEPEILAAVARVRSGEVLETVADEVWMTHERLRDRVRGAEQTEARQGAVDMVGAGATVEAAAERYGLDVGTVRSDVRREHGPSSTVAAKEEPPPAAAPSPEPEQAQGPEPERSRRPERAADVLAPVAPPEVAPVPAERLAEATSRVARLRIAYPEWNEDRVIEDAATAHDVPAVLLAEHLAAS